MGTKLTFDHVMLNPQPLPPGGLLSARLYQPLLLRGLVIVRG